MIAVVHGMVEHIQESLRRIGGEVDHDLGLRRNGPGHLDVQRDLAIGVLRVVRVGAGLVLGAIHRDRDDVGSFQAQALEIGIQIRGTEAAAVGGGELDDADDLAGSVCVRGKTVDFGKLVGGECFGSKRARLVAAGRLRNSEVRPGVRAGVEAEDRLHDGSDFGGNRGVLGMAAIARLAVHVRFEVDAEGLFHGRHRAHQVHCLAGHVRIRDRQAIRLANFLILSRSARSAPCSAACSSRVKCRR